MSSKTSQRDKAEVGQGEEAERRGSKTRQLYEQQDEPERQGRGGAGRRGRETRQQDEAVI